MTVYAQTRALAGISAQVCAHVHRALAGRLDGEQLERAGATREQQTVVACVDTLAAGRIAALDGPLNAEHDAIVERDAGADVRSERPHDAGELRRRARWVEQPVWRGDLLRVGAQPLVLLGERERLAAIERVERIHEQLAPEPLQARRERAVGVFGQARLA